ncbi:MAG: insulinase family protein [Candidatus Omnitrophica bacterium]|nr:insulinase family protein [Candidatus Omnitrophota bacterium]
MKKILLTLIMLFLAVSSCFGARDNGYSTKVLENGLKIVVKEMPSSELGYVQIRLLGGLSNEGKYAGSGISHLLEHLIFKGTEKYDSNYLMLKIRSIGGLVNAYTGQDTAAFHMQVPSEKVVDALDLLTNMIMEPVFTDIEFEKEKEVISKEMMMYDDNPGNYLMRKVNEIAYLFHPYKNPIIGYSELFKKLTKEDVLAYHKKTYVPENIVIGAAGNINKEEIFNFVSEKWGKVERRGNNLKQLAPEPMQIINIDETFYKDIHNGRFVIAYHSPSIYSKDVYALDMLSAILGGGVDSVLYKSLVEDKKLLYSISAANISPRYDGLFYITGTGDAENIDTAIIEIFKVINDFYSEKISPKMLDRVKRMTLSSFYSSRESVIGIVMTMTASELLTGGPDFYENYVKEISNVTEEEVKYVLNEYIINSKHTTVRLMPNEEKVLDEKDIIDDGEISNEPIFRTFDNGLKVIMQKRINVPLLSVVVMFPGGSAYENIEDMGISRMMTELSTKGTKNYGKDDIVPALERIGGDINAYSGSESIVYTLDIMADTIKEAMPVFKDIIFNPSFPIDEFVDIKKQNISGIKEQEKNIDFAGSKMMLKGLYSTHPYSYVSTGTIDSVENITIEKIKKYHSDHISPDQCVIAIVGDFDEDEIMVNFMDEFISWKPSNVKHSYPKVDNIKNTAETTIEMKKEQSLFILAFPSITIYDEDMYPLMLIREMLVGGGGLLFSDVRGAQGLAYSADASNSLYPENGFFSFKIKTSKENMDKVEASVWKVIEKIKNGDFDKEYLELAKMRAITGYLSGLQSNDSLASIFSSDEFIGLGYNYHKNLKNKIMGADKDSVLKAANMIFNKKAYVLVKILSEEK